MKFLPIVVTAVSAFQMPFPVVNTIGKASHSNPSCTGRFLYIDNVSEESDGQPRVLITPPVLEDARDEELIHRSLLAERLRLEKKKQQKEKAVPTTDVSMSESDISDDYLDLLSDEESPRVLITPPAAPAAVARDEEPVHRALLAERLRLEKKKVSAKYDLVSDTPVMKMKDAVLVVPMRDATGQQKERFQRSLLEERLRMEEKVRKYSSTVDAATATLQEEPVVDVIPSWQQDLIQKSSSVVDSRRQQKKEQVQRSLLEERLQMESKMRQKQQQRSSGAEVVVDEEKVDQNADTVWKMYVPESDELETESGTMWTSDEILVADLAAEDDDEEPVETKMTSPIILEQPEAVVDIPTVTDTKELFQRSLLEARLKMESKVPPPPAAPVEIVDAVVEEVKVDVVAPAVSVDIVSPKRAVTDVNVEVVAPTIMDDFLTPKISAPSPKEVLAKLEESTRAIKENKKLSELAKYAKTVSPSEIASGMVEAFTPEKGVMQLLDESDDDVKLLGYAASQFTDAVLDAGAAAFLSVAAVVGVAAPSPSEDSPMKSSVQKELEKIADAAGGSTKHAVSGCVAVAALAFKQLVRARDFIEQQKIEKELEDKRRLAEAKAVELIRARAEEAKLKVDQAAIVAEEKVVNKIRMDVDTEKQDRLKSDKKKKQDKPDKPSDDSPFFARRI